ncbi:hypothetical protein QBC42DRAFT_273212, partial [Cladorrhinum samala]
MRYEVERTSYYVSFFCSFICSRMISVTQDLIEKRERAVVFFFSSFSFVGFWPEHFRTIGHVKGAGLLRFWTAFIFSLVLNSDLAFYRVSFVLVLQLGNHIYWLKSSRKILCWVGSF